MRTRKRLKKQELKRDRFVDTVFDWALWTRENLRVVGMAIGAVALVVVALLLYRGARQSESQRASSRFQEIWQAYAVGNYQLAANDFRQFRAQFGGSDLADDATIYLASAQLRSGDYPAAIETLEDFEEQYGDSRYAYAAASLLGAAYESSGDLAKAVEAYDRARDRATFDYQKVEALMNQARVHMLQGDRDKAAAAFREVVENYPETTAAREARVRVAEAEAKPLVEAPAGADADSVAGAAGAPSQPAALTAQPAAAPAGVNVAPDSAPQQ